MSGEKHQSVAELFVLVGMDALVGHWGLTPPLIFIYLFIKYMSVNVLYIHILPPF